MDGENREDADQTVQSQANIFKNFIKHVQVFPES